MELFLPSLLFLLIAIGLVVGVVPNLSPVIMMVIAILALVVTVYNHYNVFNQDYLKLSWTIPSVAAAPYVLVGTVIVFSIGYLIFLFGSRRVSPMQLPSNRIPPPQSATNFLTSAIGTGLSRTGLVNVSPPSTLGNLTSAELRSVASKIA